MRNISVCFGVLAAGLLWTSPAWATTEYVWTGAAGDGKWATAGNWEVDGAVATACPCSYDAVARFTNEVIQTVSVDRSGNTILYPLSALLIERGTNTFTHPGNSFGFRICDSTTKTGTIYVAANARLNMTCDIGTGEQGRTLTKTGPGTWRLNGGIYLGYYAGRPGCIHIKEGLWDNAATLHCSNIVVASGARVETTGSGRVTSGASSFPDLPHIHVEKGAVFYGNGGYLCFDGVTGEGTFKGCGQFYLSRGPYRFDGTIEPAGREWILVSSSFGAADNRRIIVGRPSNFKPVSFYDYVPSNGDFVRFAADQGGVFEFCAGYNMGYTTLSSKMTAEDENGIGVIVKIGGINFTNSDAYRRFHLAGKGTFLLPTVSIDSTNTLTCVSGLVGTKPQTSVYFSCGTASEASTNLLGDAGTICSAGTLYYRSHGLVQRGALTGTNGTVRCESPTTFLHFNLRDGMFCPQVEDSAGAVRVYDGLASLTTLDGGANYGCRTLRMYGGVIAGPLATDTALATVVPTRIPRPVAPVTKYEPSQWDYYISSTHVCLWGNAEFHAQPYSASISTTFDNLRRGTLFVYGALRYLESVNGSRIAMCPPDTSEFRPSTDAITVGADGGEFISGPSANGAEKNYAIRSLAGEGAVARYGAGFCRFVDRPTGYSGTLRILDGRFGLNENVADTSLTGTGPVELGSAKIERTSVRRLLLNATTISGGALIVPGEGRAQFTSLAFEKGGALFLDQSDVDYAFLTQPTEVPIFHYASGTITKNTSFCTADHLVLDGTELADAQTFSAHGILAVQSDTTVSAALAGADGVGIVGPADGTKRVVTLSGASTVTGGTYVNAVEVRPTSAQAFGSGAVTVGPGEWMGGRLRFTKPLDFSANAFTAGGWGPVDEQGALIFEASTTLGSLAVSRPLRLRIDAGVTATVNGAVDSDENIQIAGNGGTLVLNGGKDGEGRLDIIRAKVTLAGAQPALGTGHIWLDDGTIEFANTEPLVVSNLIYGVGQIICKGADVTFASPSLDFDGTIRVPGSAHVAFPTQCRLGDNLQIRFSQIHDRGAVVDLGGVYRTVDRVVGFGRVTNTSFTQKHPWTRGGLMILVQ